MAARDDNPVLNPRRVPSVGRRLNQRVLWIIGLALLIFVAIIGYVGQLRHSIEAVAKDDEHGDSASGYADGMMANRSGYIPAAVHAVPPLPTPQPIPLAKDTPPPPSPPDEDQGAKARKAAYDAARTAKAGIASYQRETPPLAPAQRVALQKADPNNLADVNESDWQAYQRRLAEVQTAMNQNPNAPYSSQRDPNALSTYQGGPDRFRLHTRVEAPESPYILQTGTLIPAAAVTGIDSDLPGAITAQVTHGVYDSIQHRHLLIPPGARLYGEYASGNSVQYGQSRLFVAWQRLLFPDGRTLDLGAMPGTDAQGESGLRDLADSHWLRTFGSALVMSAITAGVAISQPQQNGYGGSMSASGALSESLGQNLGSAMSQLLGKNLNVAPTLKIRPGFALRVMIVKDAVFPGAYHPQN